MTETKIPTRAEIPDQYKWNAEFVFTTSADFDAALAELPGVLEGMAKFKDHLSMVRRLCWQLIRRWTSWSGARTS